MLCTQTTRNLSRMVKSNSVNRIGTPHGMMSSSWGPILSTQERQTTGNDEFQLGTDSVHTRKTHFREWWVPVGHRFCLHKKGRLQGMMSSSWGPILSTQERHTTGNDEFQLGTDSVHTRKADFREWWVTVGQRFCLHKKGRLRGMMSSGWAPILSAQERHTSGNYEFQLGTDSVCPRKADFREWWVPVGHWFCLHKRGRLQGMMSSSWAPIMSPQERQTSGNDEFQLGTDSVCPRKADSREWWVPVGHRFCQHKKGRLQGMMSSSWAPILSAQETSTIRTFLPGTLVGWTTWSGKAALRIQGNVSHHFWLVTESSHGRTISKYSTERR